MPRQYKRRNYRRSAGFNRRTGSGLLESSPLPKKFKVKMKYVDETMTLDPGSGGVPVTKVYSLNGLFDPDITGSGHQPLGYDQFMQMYDHYTVIGARARITATNKDTGTPIQVIASIRDKTTTTTNIGQIIENGLNRWTTLGVLTSGNSTKTLTINFSTKNFFSKSPLQEADLQGTLNNNPVEQAYLHIIVHPLDAVDTSPVLFTIEIEYIAIMTEPKLLAQS